MTYDPSAAHDEEQGFHRKVAEALDASGMHYQQSRSLPRGTPPSPNCPNDGSCIAGHQVPLEGGYAVEMNVRNGRMDPFITHECEDGHINPIEDTSESFGHPLHGLGVNRTPTTTLAEAMKNYTFHPGTIKAIMAHRREFH